MSTEPIVAETTVPVARMKAFVGFTAQMGEWWDPLLTPDAGTFTGIEVDPEGDVSTVHDGGDNYVFGRMTTWEPHEELVMDFWLGHAPAYPTELRVTFTDADDESTTVRLEHRGWNADNEAAHDKYDHWDDQLERYAAHVVSH